MKKAWTLLVISTIMVVGTAVLVVGTVGLMAGCSKVEQNFKHAQSDLSGLKRSITLYSPSGGVIQKWEGTYRIEVEGSYISFIDKNKNIKLSGTIVVQEL